MWYDVKLLLYPCLININFLLAHAENFLIIVAWNPSAPFKKYKTFFRVSRRTVIEYMSGSLKEREIRVLFSTLFRVLPNFHGRFYKRIMETWGKYFFHKITLRKLKRGYSLLYQSVHSLYRSLLILLWFRVEQNCRQEQLTDSVFLLLFFCHF